jgi:hypothetical protein
MTQDSPRKLLPRNVAALRAGQSAEAATRIVAGNSVATRLESGVGNCFPGLECDLRNLERRFFPFLEIETDFGRLLVAAVDLAGVNAARAAGTIDAATAQAYQRIDQDLRQGASWSVAGMTGNFGPLGQQSFDLSQLDGQSTGPNRRPSDAWAAARLLVADSPVTLDLVRNPPPGQLSLSGPRARYLDETGALARMFEPGELTQSLCSPWTHDFRDCACFYWAANHPDIALPPLPNPAPPADDPRWNRATGWERADRALQSPPIATADGPLATAELAHHEINRDWQLLNFALERRERVAPYVPGAFTARPLADQAELISHLRYAAGVELAVMQEYLTAAWSLKPPDGQPQPLRDDLRAAFAELLRVAIGEMRHLRAVNDVLAGFAPAGSFQPALAVAAQVPDMTPGTFRPTSLRAATPEVLDHFVAIEAPSQSVDGLYGRILATIEGGIGDDEQEQLIRTVMAEGQDHWQTFLFVREWLGRHDPATYLRAANLQPPPAGNPAHQTLQQRYRNLLEGLHQGYQLGVPAGAPEINAARAAMLAADGIRGALDAVAAEGFLVVFDPLTDSRFAPIGPP